MKELFVSGLYRYPIKGCAGEPLQEAKLDSYGIVGDRRGMLVDPEGRFLTQRELPKMALIQADTDSGYLRLKAGSANRIVCQLDLRGRCSEVVVWKDSVIAIDQGDTPARYLSNFLETECRLVWMPPDFHRPVDERFATGPHTTFSDSFPLLIAGDASLADLNSRLDVRVGMDRFRPNITVAGSEAFAEDTWRKVQVGDVDVQLLKFCARCVVTTTDQQRGTVSGKEPLTTLAKYRTITEPVTGKKGAMFGQLAAHFLREGKGSLRLGDLVKVLSLRE